MFVFAKTSGNYRGMKGGGEEIIIVNRYMATMELPSMSALMLVSLIAIENK